MLIQEVMIVSQNISLFMHIIYNHGLFDCLAFDGSRTRIRCLGASIFNSTGDVHAYCSQHHSRQSSWLYIRESSSTGTYFWSIRRCSKIFWFLKCPLLHSLLPGHARPGGFRFPWKLTGNCCTFKHFSLRR